MNRSDKFQSGSIKVRHKKPPHSSECGGFFVRLSGGAYTTPNASIASATFLKPAMFAPFT
jgi:hypothetical protein